MSSKRVCAEFENKIHIERHSENGLPTIDDETGEDIYSCKIQCMMHPYLHYSKEEREELREKQRKKGCNGSCGGSITKSEVEQIIAFIQDLRA